MKRAAAWATAALCRRSNGSGQPMARYPAEGIVLIAGNRYYAGCMKKSPSARGGAESTEQRDRMLRRLIVVFVLAAVATFWAAVGVSALHGPAYRLELAQQQAAPPTAP